MSSVKNIGSSILENQENEVVFSLLEPKCQSLHTTVAQLYATIPPHHLQWTRINVGVLCLVKDNHRKTYFFKLFSIDNREKIWEMEIYLNMEYIASTKFFHTFEGENTIYAFNFADISEAVALKNTVESVISRLNRIYGNSQEIIPPVIYTKVLKTLNGKHKKKKQKTPKIDILNISQPSNFRHLSHVGFDQNEGFNTYFEDEEMRKLFQSAGVTKKQLKNTETRKNVVSLINERGGIAFVKQYNAEHAVREALPPVPPRVFAPCPPAAPAPPPPLAPELPPSRQGLLDNIEKGISLRKLEELDSKGTLLEEIRGGIKLKTVVVSSKPNVSQDNDLASALKKVVMARSRDLNVSSSEEDSSSDDADWD